MDKVYNKPNKVEKHLFCFIYDDENKASLGSCIDLYRIQIPEDFPNICSKKYLSRHNYVYYVNDRSIEDKLLRLMKIFTGNNEKTYLSFVFLVVKDDVPLSGVFTLVPHLKLLTGSTIQARLYDINILTDMHRDTASITTHIIW